MLLFVVLREIFFCIFLQIQKIFLKYTLAGLPLNLKKFLNVLYWFVKI